MGDVVNTSARLMKGSENDILIDDATYRKTKSQLICLPLPPRKLKGKETPVQIYKIN